LAALQLSSKNRLFSKGELGKVAGNILQRQFVANKPNEKWIADVNEFNVLGESLYRY
jgi:putative transposase